MTRERPARLVVGPREGSGSVARRPLVSGGLFSRARSIRSPDRSHVALRAPAASTYEKKMLAHVFVRPCLYVYSTRPLVLVKHSVCFHYDSYALLYLGHYIIRAIGLGPHQMMMVMMY